MKLPRRPCTQILVLALVTVGLVRWGWLLGSVLSSRGQAQQAVADEPRAAHLASVPAFYRDAGIACLVTGTCSPPIDQLSSAEIDWAASLLALLLCTYETASFESFLEFRRADLGCPGVDRTGDLLEFAQLLDELTGSFPGTPKSLQEGLGSYWSALYEKPPVTRFLPETTVVRVHAKDIRDSWMEDWDDSFIRLREEISGGSIDHRMVIPHCRSVEAIARESPRLRWVDIRIAFYTQLGARAVLVSRFVWDGIGGSWFLHRASTVYSDDYDPILDRGFLIL